MDTEELKTRLRDHEDGWVERKTKNIKSEEICEALVGFANSLPQGQQGILFIGVSNDGASVGVDDTDGMQKKVERWSKWCYPAVPYTARVVEDSGKHIVAVIVQASPDRPHFAGPAFIRVGSQSQKPSEKKFNELIDRRNSLVTWILDERDKGRQVYIEDKTRHGMPRTLCKVVDCNSQSATFQTVAASDDVRTFPVKKIYMTMNQGLAMFSIEP